MMAVSPRPQSTGRGISRSALLATAAELFARKGYRATTLDDIASELGLKKASLYHYIRSKDELLADIYQQIFDRIEAEVAPLVSLDLPVDERLRRMVNETSSMEVITTHTEAEALLLEANLIKRLKPRFNIVLRDDKSYPWLMLTDDHPYPQIAKHRGAQVRTVPETAIPDVLARLARGAADLGRMPFQRGDAADIYAQLETALDQLGRLDEVKKYCGAI